MAVAVATLVIDAGMFMADFITAIIPTKDTTKVQITIGHSDTTSNLGGNAPWVALYDNYGMWMGFGFPKRDKTWEMGSVINGPDGGIDVPHEGLHTEKVASYILLSNSKNDAVCIATISVSDYTTQTAFSGDMGKYCGMPWYPSNLEMGSNRRTPKCVWLDGDNSNGLPQALSFQLEAFADSADKMAQYAKWPDTLCRSTPRFSIWQDLDWNSQIPIFKPKLDYYDDSATGGQGADMDFGRIVDSDDCKYDKKKERQLKLDTACQKKGVWSSALPPPWYQDKSHKSHKRHDRRHPPQNRAGDFEEFGMSHGMNYDTARRLRLPRGGKKLAARFAEQLVVSTKSSHSSTAAELCDSETSFGPDFVSTEEGLFCSMSQKKTFPLCSRDSEADASTCFDLGAKELVVPKSLDTAHTKRILDELPITNYTLVRRW